LAFFVFSEGKIIAIVKKCNLNNIFHEGKGHFATGERALFVFSENLGGLGPSGSYAPAFGPLKNWGGGEEGFLRSCEYPCTIH
jgi:hypothetical protein